MEDKDTNKTACLNSINYSSANPTCFEPPLIPHFYHNPVSAGIVSGQVSQCLARGIAVFYLHHVPRKGHTHLYASQHPTPRFFQKDIQETRTLIDEARADLLKYLKYILDDVKVLLNHFVTWNFMPSH